jgi:hypothetical protein
MLQSLWREAGLKSRPGIRKSSPRALPDTVPGADFRGSPVWVKEEKAAKCY